MEASVQWSVQGPETPVGPVRNLKRRGKDSLRTNITNIIVSFPILNQVRDGKHPELVVRLHQWIQLRISKRFSDRSLFCLQLTSMTLGWPSGSGSCRSCGLLKSCVTPSWREIRWPEPFEITYCCSQLNSVSLALAPSVLKFPIHSCSHQRHSLPLWKGLYNHLWIKNKNANLRYS